MREARRAVAGFAGMQRLRWGGYQPRGNVMSRSTRWILAGAGLLVVAGVFAIFGFAITTTPDGSTGATFGFMTVASLIAAAGIFAVQVGVMALAVHIGTYEIRKAMPSSTGAPGRGGPETGATSGGHLPPRGGP